MNDPPSDRPTPRHAVGTILVGRDREMAALEGALEGAFEGRGSLLLVAGEPGIGKTRLADELTSRARGRGARAVWGRCWESGGAPPYWPWIQAIRGYARGQTSEALTARLGGRASDIARIVPDLWTVGDEGPPPSEAGSARLRLFDALTGFLVEAAAEQPLVIVLDDLHAADAPSLELLRFLAPALADSRMLVLGTYRDVELEGDDPFGATLADLMRERTTRRVLLTGLERSAVARYIQMVAGTAPAETVVDAVHRQTEGNPLYVGETIRLLELERRLGDPRDAVSVKVALPSGVREAITGRLGHLSSECRRILALASIFGREFGLHLLGIAADLPGERLLPLMEEAISARLVTEVPGGLEQLRFSHGLIRDAIYEQLPATRRLHLHANVGRLLENQYAADLDTHLAELAHHFRLALPVLDAPTAVDYARRAGDRSLRLLAFEEAARHYRTALDVSELSSPVDQTLRCELLLSLGEATARGGDLTGARKAFLRAAELAQQKDLPALLARSALGYGGRFVWARAGGDRNVRRLLEAALEALGPADGTLRAMVLARLAGVRRDDHARQPRWSLSRQAVDMARRLGDPATLAYALEARYAAIWEPGNAGERLDIATEMVRLGEETGDVERAFQARGFRFHVLFELGDVAGARAEIRMGEAVTRALAQPAQRWLMTVEAAAMALFDGRFDEAESLIDDALAFGRDAQNVDAEVSFRLQTYFLRREQGRAAEMEPLLRASVEEFPWYPMFRCVLADLHTHTGDEDAARAIFERLGRDGFGTLPVDSQWLFSLSLLAEVAWFLRDAPGAEALYGLLLPFGDRNGYSPPEVGTGSAARALGLAAATTSRWGEAIQHLDDALEMNVRMGALPWVAHTRRDLARTLLHRDAPGDVERAADLLGQAEATGARLGMVPVRESASSMLESIGSAGRTGASGRPREMNVFRREGEYWSIAFQGRAVRVKDTKGLRYLAELLGAAGREIPALDLLALGEGRHRPTGPSDSREERLGTDLGGSEALLDPAARSAYRRRMHDLAEEIDEAESLGDAQRAGRAKEELDFITSELAAAMGLGGRPRTASSPSERARQSVTKALKAAVERIERHHPALGQHLSSTVRTGTFCLYLPDPTVSWNV